VFGLEGGGDWARDLRGLHMLQGPSTTGTNRDVEGCAILAILVLFSCWNPQQFRFERNRKKLLTRHNSQVTFVRPQNGAHWQRTHTHVLSPPQPSSFDFILLRGGNRGNNRHAALRGLVLGVLCLGSFSLGCFAGCLLPHAIVGCGRWLLVDCGRCYSCRGTRCC
jgi:hypothetical protein